MKRIFVRYPKLLIVVSLVIFLSVSIIKPYSTNSKPHLPKDWAFSKNQSPIEIIYSKDNSKYYAYLLNYKNDSLNQAWLITNIDGSAVKDRNLYFELAETAEAVTISKEYPYDWLKERVSTMNKLYFLIESYQVLSMDREILMQFLGVTHSLFKEASKKAAKKGIKLVTASVSSSKFKKEFAKSILEATGTEGAKALTPARVGSIAELLAININIYYLYRCKTGLDEAYSIIDKHRNNSTWNTDDAKNFITSYYTFWRYKGAVDLFNNLTSDVGTPKYWLTLGGDIVADVAGSPINASDIEDGISIAKGYSEIDNAMQEFDQSMADAEKGEIAWRERSYDCLHSKTYYDKDNFFVNYAYILFNDLNSSSNNPKEGMGLFQDNFSNGMHNWVGFGSPKPMIEQSMGDPAPSFNNNGDASYDSGAYTKDKFNPVSTVLEGDIYIKAHPSDCWTACAIGFERPNAQYSDECSSPFSIYIGYRYDGDACWAIPKDKREHGKLTVGLLKDDGNWESQIWVNDNLLNAWHRYKIVILPDRHVKFYVDSSLIYSSTYTLSSQINNVSILLGSRSYDSDSLIDNVQLSKLPGVSVPRNNCTETVKDISNVLVYFNGPIEIRSGPGPQYEYINKYLSVGGMSVNSIWPKKCKKDRNGNTWYLIPPADSLNNVINEGKAWFTGKNLTVIDYNKLRKFTEKKVNSIRCIINSGATVRFGPGDDFKICYTTAQRGKAIIIAESRDPKGQLWYKFIFGPSATETDMVTPQWVLSKNVTIISN